MWRNLRGSALRQAEYLALLEAASLPTVFKSCLTAPLLAGILNIVLRRLGADRSEVLPTF